MFVSIHRDNSEPIRVPYSTYLSTYKNKGFEIIDDKKKENKKTVENKPAETKKEVKADAGIVEDKIDIDTIPVSEMTNKQLREYARKHGINMKGVKNSAQARERVMNAMPIN